MNRTRTLASGIVMAFALMAMAGAQQAPNGAVDHPQGPPTVESHLKVLAEKLDLTADQQAKAKPILEEMHASWQKLDQDQSLSQEDRASRRRAMFEKADKQLRVNLTDEQKKKLDQIEQEQHAHSPAHGNAN